MIKMLCFLAVLVSVFHEGVAARAQTLVPATENSNAKLLGLEVDNGEGASVMLDAEFVVQPEPKLNSFNGVFGEGLPPNVEGYPFFDDDLVGTENAATAILEKLSTSDIAPAAFFGFPSELANAPYFLGGFEGGGGDLGKLFFPLNVSADRVGLVQVFASFDNNAFGEGEIFTYLDDGSHVLEIDRSDSWCNNCQAFFVGEGVEIWVILRAAALTCSIQ